MAFARRCARFTIEQALAHRLSRSALVNMLIAGRVRRLPAFVREPILLHTAEYTRRHPEFFAEMKARFKARSNDEFQARFWGSDFGYMIIRDSHITFGAKEFYEYFRKATEELGGSSYLDVGCGRGTLCRWLKRSYPEAEVFGLDVSHNVLEAARRQTRREGLAVHFVEGSAVNLREHFEEDSIDVVTCTDSFQNIEEGIDVLRQMAEIAVKSVFVTSPRGTLSREEYLRATEPVEQLDYDLSWAHPLVAYARRLNLPVYRQGFTSKNCYYLDVRF